MSNGKRHAKRMVAIHQPEKREKERAPFTPPPNDEFHRSLIEMSRSNAAVPYVPKERKGTRRSKDRDAILASKMG